MFERAEEQIQAQSQVLAALFPGTRLSDLTGKSRDELLSLLSTPAIHNVPRVDAAPPATGQENPGDASNADDDSASESGEPPAERQWDESLDQPAAIASDDINAIGFAADHQARSYLGITSISAVFRAIFRLCPAAKEHSTQNARGWAAAEPQPTPLFGRDPAMGLLKEQRCIDFYFEHIHAITPILDEQDFRRQYASGSRNDASWMGLLNMVFTLGSLASGSERLHEHFYQEARSFLGIDTLGSGNLESLQALVLLGGYYLHYRNSPNMGYSVLGAAHRMAVALGLHREPRRRPTIADFVEADEYRRRVETRRRTWWGLFCLDTWSSMPQGRPTCGRWDSKTMDTTLDLPHPDDHAGLSLRASTQFCLICDKIQHRVAQITRLTTHEILEFDAEIQAWYATLPPRMMEPANSTPRFHVAREFLRNRYFGARLILYRTALLYLLYEWKRGNEELVPDQKQQQVLDRAYVVASQAIDCIALYWTPNRVHVWNSSWYLFQACMVPLLYMAMERTMQKPSSPESRASWRASMDKALETFAEMRPWMRAADRAPDIVSALYEALSAESDGPIPTPSADGSLDIFDIFGGWDEQIELDWCVFLGDKNPGQGTYRGV